MTTVEIKDVEIPERMQHAIARQAEAERERRAKIINAEGEFQAAARLAEAGEVIGANPTTLQLRYLQTLREIGGSQNSTVVFPMPIDLVRPVLEAAGKTFAAGDANTQPESLPAGEDEDGHPALGTGGPEITVPSSDDPALAQRPQPPAQDDAVSDPTRSVGP